jgi:hypothetical protein
VEERGREEGEGEEEEVEEGGGGGVELGEGRWEPLGASRLSGDGWIQAVLLEVGRSLAEVPLILAIQRVKKLEGPGASGGPGVVSPGPGLFDGIYRIVLYL